MQLVPERPNVELRGSGDDREVVLSFPYDRELVNLVRTIPHRRFDWETYEWSAPAEDWAGIRVAEILARYPDLQPDPAVQAWLAGIEQRWIGFVATARFNGGGHFRLQTRAGHFPPELLAVGIEQGEELMVPMTQAAAEILRDQRSARLSVPAVRAIETLELGLTPPPARLKLVNGFTGTVLKLEVVFDPDTAPAFEALPGAEGNEMPLDPWLAEPLDHFIARHEVELDFEARRAVETLMAERALAADAVRRSRAREADPLAETALRLGGELAPFQWAGVRYLLEARRSFLADEQGLGKTVEALATLEADDAYPAVVVCPAAMKLVWEREAAHWLPHRSLALLQGRSAGPPDGAEITIVNYEIVEAHRRALAARRPRALVIDESHYVKNPQAKRTRAVRRLAEAVAPDGLKLALTGTPVLNHAEELVAQLRVLDRMQDFGSAATFARQFRGPLDQERLHWHLRRRCFVRRLKSEVLPQLPAKRQVVIPVALTNQREYGVAEKSVVDWLRTQPLDLKVLNAKIAATLRAERLAQLGTLQRLAARGKLAASLSWISDFLESGEALVVFCRHVEVQHRLVRHFPDALHILGEDSAQQRQRAIDAFQDPDGPQLLIAATRVAGQGITLTRASNVAFLELEWTPAMHDQAEDRCHRIGQRDAVTAYYLLAAGTIDETMARLIQSKRATIAAVVDGQGDPQDGLVQGVVRELRDGKPFQHLRAVS